MHIQQISPPHGRTEFARRHFFLAGAIALLALMLLAAGVRLIFPAKHAAGGGAGAAGHATQVTAVSAKMQCFTDRIEALGTAKANQSVNLSSNNTEVITAVRVRDGAHVQKGQVLVELKAREQAADTAEAVAALEVARSNYNRYDKLAKAGYLAPSAMDQNRAALRQAEAGLAAARSRQADRTIRAPFSGRLGLSDVAPGALINPGATIVTLDDTSVMRVDFEVPDRYLPALKVGATIEARPDPYPEQHASGRIALVDSRIDPNTHAIRARAEFNNKSGHLVPGMLMHVTIGNGQRNSVAVPEAAVQSEGDQSYVYVIAHQGDHTIAQRAEVQVGDNQSGFIEIRTGLTAGTQVVANGLSRVQPNAAIKIVGDKTASSSSATPGAKRPAR